MKEIFYFLKWSYHKSISSIKSWDHWMWAWLATCFFASSWLNSPKGSTLETINHGILSAIILFYWVGYIIVFNGIKKAWSSYQEEKQKVINILGERNEFSADGR